MRPRLREIGETKRKIGKAYGQIGPQGYNFGALQYCHHQLETVLAYWAWH